LPLLAQVAQLVEQRIENPRVGGSIPSLGTIFPFPAMILHRKRRLCVPFPLFAFCLGLAKGWMRNGILRTVR
jgi:hypothetical protein